MNGTNGSPQSLPLRVCQMELQMPERICNKTPEKSVLRRTTEGNRKNIKRSVQLKISKVELVKMQPKMSV